MLHHAVVRGRGKRAVARVPAGSDDRRCDPRTTDPQQLSAHAEGRVDAQTEDVLGGPNRQGPVDEHRELNESNGVLSSSARHGVERRPGIRWNQWPTRVESAGSCRLARDTYTKRTRLDHIGHSSQANWQTGSVGQGGSVGQRKKPYSSSNYSGRTGVSVVLKLRRSTVRFRPRHHFLLDETHPVSDITRGQKMFYEY